MSGDYTDIEGFIDEVSLAALTDPYYEELILAGLNSGPPSPLTCDDFEQIRTAILNRHSSAS